MSRLENSATRTAQAAFTAAARRSPPAPLRAQAQAVLVRSWTLACAITPMSMVLRGQATSGDNWGHWLGKATCQHGGDARTHSAHTRPHACRHTHTQTHPSTPEPFNCRYNGCAMRATVFCRRGELGANKLPTRSANPETSDRVAHTHTHTHCKDNVSP